MSDIESQIDAEMNSQPKDQSQPTQNPVEADIDKEMQASHANTEQNIDQEMNQDKYVQPEEQIKAGLEGAAQGVLGPLAPLAETHLLGVKPEDIAGRAKENPLIHAGSETAGLVGSMLIPGTQASILAKIPEVAVLGKVGGMALKGVLEAAAIQGSDEVSKYITGQEDPQAPVASALAHMGAAALFGGATGTLFGAIGTGANKGLQALKNSEMGDKAKSILTGYGLASQGESVEEMLPSLESENLDKSLLKLGEKFHNEGPDKIGKYAADKLSDYGSAVAGSAAGTALGGPAGTIAGAGAGWGVGKALEPIAEKIIGKPVAWGTRKFILPMITKALISDNPEAIGQAFDFATKASRGAQTINNAVNSLFNKAGQQAINYDINQRQRNAIEKYIDNNGLQQEFNNTLHEQSLPQMPLQGFAEGGKVEQQQPQEENHLAKVFPNQNCLLSSAKGRVYTYLNSIKPRPSVNKLPFDPEPSQKIAKQQYDNALDIATNPLIVMKHLKSGNLSAEHVKHFTGMWPELHNELSKEVTKRITNAQIQGEKPSYRVRQGLSMFMGTALEGSFTPFSIQAAQSVFAPKAPQQPAQGAPKMKRGTAKLGSKSNNLYQTADQDAEKDRSARN